MPADESLMCANTMGGGLGRRGKLPLPSACDQIKLNAEGADSSSTVYGRTLL